MRRSGPHQQPGQQLSGASRSDRSADVADPRLLRAAQDGDAATIRELLAAGARSDGNFCLGDRPGLPLACAGAERALYALAAGYPVWRWQ